MTDRKTISVCQRCGHFTLTNNIACNVCGKVDNDFCDSCHKYNHAFDTSLKYLGKDITRELDNSNRRSR